MRFLYKGILCQQQSGPPLYIKKPASFRLSPGFFPSHDLSPTLVIPLALLVGGEEDAMHHGFRSPTPVIPIILSYNRSLFHYLAEPGASFVYEIPIILSYNDSCTT
jgi:hypothetical protein